MKRGRTTIGILATGLLAVGATASRGAEIDYFRDVYPILKANCISCHNKTTTKAGLNMETPELMKKGGESGPGVIPGKSAESLVVQAAAHQEDYVMPPKNNKSGAVDLTASELALLKAWIDQGAKHSEQQARTVKWQPLPAGISPIFTVAMTKDGRFAACARANRIFVYDLATRQFVTNVADASGTAHRAIVESLAFSPDGERLASGSFREVKIWHRESAGTAVHKADSASGTVAATVSADGKVIVSADKAGSLHLVEAASGKAVRTIENASSSPIKLVSVSPDGTQVAVYAADDTLSRWNLHDGSRIGVETGLKGVRVLAWMRDGEAIVTGGDDKIVRISEALPPGVEELTPPKELKGATGAITALIVGEKDLVLAASEDGKVRSWKVSDGKIVRTFNVPGVRALSLSRDGQRLAAGCADGTVRIFDASSGAAVAELRGDLKSKAHLADLDWTAAKQALELAFQTKEVARIETENKALDELLKKANETIVNVKKALPDKQKAAQTATEQRVAAEKAVESAAPAASADAPPSPAQEKEKKAAQDKLMAAMMAESSAVAAASAAEHNIEDAEAEVKRITATKTKNGETISAANAAIARAKELQAKATAEVAAAKQALTKPGAAPLATALSADGQEVTAFFSDGTQRTWAIASSEPVAEAALGAATTNAVLALDAAGDFVGCAAEGGVARTSLSSRWVLERVLSGNAFADRVNAVHFSPDGKALAVGGGEPSRSGDVSLWNVASGKLIANWPERHSDAVLSLDFSPDGKLLASGGADKLARVTEIATGKQVQLFEGHTHHVMGVAFRADGRVLATAGADGVVLIWDMILGERKKKIEGWSKEVTSLQYIGATSQIVTSAGDNLVRIVSDDGGVVRAIANLPEFMQSAASTPSGNVVIAGGEDSVLRAWDGASGKEIAVFQPK
jgi:WD40 repeat protein